MKRTLTLPALLVSLAVVVGMLSIPTLVAAQGCGTSYGGGYSSYNYGGYGAYPSYGRDYYRPPSYDYGPRRGSSYSRRVYRSTRSYDPYRSSRRSTTVRIRRQWRNSSRGCDY